MDPREIDVLVQRLLANPHDRETLAYAHREGARDPRLYATILEKVGTASTDPAYASYWLTEAANVWATSLGDAHRTARLLMMALEKDPAYDIAAERLAQLYRDNGEKKALVALLERRVKTLEPMAAHSEETRALVAAMHEELGQLWDEPPLSQPKKALDRYRRAIELDPKAAHAIYVARELCKREQMWAEALPLFEAEQKLVQDPARKLALYRDEAAVRELAGDAEGVTAALRAARAFDPNDAALAQELGASILDRLTKAQPVSKDERREAVEIFVTLAEAYDGEHGYAYACAALDIEAGHDRAMQLAAHWASDIGRGAELVARWQAYLQANPQGPLAMEARNHGAVATSASAEVVEDLGDELLLADDIPALLKSAGEAATRGERDEALALYKDVLALDATQPEAFAWVEDHHRQGRQYGELRDLLLSAARSPSSSHDVKKQHYREIAGLCETHLRDLEGAIQAYRQICQLDRADEIARDQLRRLLERARRWDDLAALLEQEATSAPDLETRILLERRLAQLHEGKRRDPVSAGEAWARIAGLTPDDDSAISTAVEFFLKGERLDLGAAVIAENVGSIDDETTRASLLERLGELREKAGDQVGAGDAFAEAAKLRASEAAWDAAERCFVAAERWEEAARTAAERAELVEGQARAGWLAREGELLVRAGQEERAIKSFERALELHPENDALAREVTTRYEAAGRIADLVSLLLLRASRVEDAELRVRLRKQAAELQISKLEDRAAARESLLAVLEDGEDTEVLATLADQAEKGGDFTAAVSLLQRLAAVTEERSARLVIVLREAALLSDELADPDAAIAKYEEVLSDLDPKNRLALERIARLYEEQGDHATLALTLERKLTLAETDEERIALGRRLAKLYEGPLDDAKRAVVAFETVHRLDEEDFDAIARLYELSSKLEDWKRAAEYLGMLVEVEGDDEEHAALSRKLAEILADRLDQSEKALEVLSGPADAGDSACREAYVALGDRAGRAQAVAAKLLDWYLATPVSEARTEALQGAFERFVATGKDEDAVRVAMQLVRSPANADMAQKLEEVALRAKDLDALAMAHDRMTASLSGLERAMELTRQAKVLARAGVAASEAIQHGELGLGSLPLEDAEPLLERLAALTTESDEVIDLFERQVARARQPVERLRALAKAAEVAAERGAEERARSFFGLALSGNVPEEAIESLEAVARAYDEKKGDAGLRRMLAEALAQGGQGLRDGGRTRNALLRRAASMAESELSDLEQAFVWLGDALIAHVEPATLDALDALATRAGEPERFELAIERALGEVFDGPLVRQLLSRRIELRRERLGDAQGAAEDLKRLHDLAPSDSAIADELATMLTELEDHRGMVQLLEDQILRGRDPHARAELARQVARIWEEKLDEPREAADAWRRVLRMKPGDAEAQEGLERAKAGMLKKPAQDGASSARLSSPPRASVPPRKSVLPPRSSVRPPAKSSRPSAAPMARAPSIAPPPLPETSLVTDALLIDDAEPIEERTVDPRASIKPPPMPAVAPPLPVVAGLSHSAPPALPAERDGEVMLVDDAELLDDV